MVTLNYCLAAFGHLVGKAYRSLDPAGGTGNAGVLDQRAALQWVHDNIRYFGDNMVYGLDKMIPCATRPCICHVYGLDNDPVCHMALHLHLSCELYDM
jgi:hypothetical protein